MQLTGTVIKILPIQSGVGKKGTWAKLEFVIETQSQYPKQVALSLWGQEKIDNADLVEGMTLTAHIELESREYNGRYYTEARAWKIEGSDRSGARRSTPSTQQDPFFDNLPTKQGAQVTPVEDDDADTLPF